jgi:hypothetical protein
VASWTGGVRQCNDWTRAGKPRSLTGMNRDFSRPPNLLSNCHWELLISWERICRDYLEMQIVKDKSLQVSDNHPRDILISRLYHTLNSEAFQEFIHRLTAKLFTVSTAHTNSLIPIQCLIDRASRYNLITRTNLIHFTFTFTLLKLKASTYFGYHLPILRRHYTNTVLVGVAC